MKKYYKILSLILALCMLVGTISVFAADTDDPVETDDPEEITDTEPPADEGFQAASGESSDDDGVYLFAADDTQAVYYVATSGSNTAGDGSIENPWQTVSYGLAQITGGDALYIQPGIYTGALTISDRLTGKLDMPTVIAKAPDATGEVIIDAGGSGTVFAMNNIGNVVIDGLTIRNGGYGINYQSTSQTAQGGLTAGYSYDDPDSISPFNNITISNCKIYNINGTHGVCVYARNYWAPVTNLVFDKNEVYFNRVGSSEAVVLNGNIDGFVVSNNYIHNNNNIGIDLIGFESTARGPADWGANGILGRDRYNFTRNGLVFNNVVYGSSTINNVYYWGEGSSQTLNGIGFSNRYDRSSGGIYVDGGQDIEIFNNLVWDNDIGIEVASERTVTAGSEAYWVRNVNVRNNIIASNRGWVGLAFGGYASGLAYTENCEFTNNVFYGNATHIAVQKSRNNLIEGNVAMNGTVASIGTNYRPLNDFSYNVWVGSGGISNLPAAQLAKQVILPSSVRPLANPVGGDFSFVKSVLEGTTVDLSDFAGEFGLDLEMWEVNDYFGMYADYTDAYAELTAAISYLHAAPFSFAETYANGNARDYLTQKLHAAGFVNSEVLYILQTSNNTSTTGLGHMPDGPNTAGGTNAGIVDRTLPNNGNNAVLRVYGPEANGRAAVNGNVNRERYESTLATLALHASRNYAYQVQVITWYGETTFTQEVAAIRLNMYRAPLEFSVNYNANGGSGSTLAQPVFEGAKFTTYAANYFTPPLNKVFVEWNTEADGSGDSYAAGAEYDVVNGGLTLYAIWTWRTTYTYHVAVNGDNNADGSEANPWATVTYALTRIRSGDTLLIHEGRYVGRYVINGELSGLYKERPTVIMGAGDGEVILDGGATGTVITINNCGDLVIEGLTVTNATSNGIMYYAQNNAAANARVDEWGFDIETDDPSLSPFANVVIRNNKVYNINTSAFAIGFYAQNIRAPLADLIIDGNEVFCNRNYWSEGVTLNGNIDRFEVCNNLIYNNNNIGICMIGFENTARLPAAPGLGNGLLGRHKYDNARNGKCYNNTVYGSVVISNEAYWFPEGDTLGTRQGPEEGEYSRCTNGIYVCGGQSIEIFNNLVFDCDIGIEISTEHQYPDFWIENIYVHDNIIANCVGWNGLSIGGQSMDPDFEQTYVSGIAGQTKNSRVENNILYGNIVNMNIQHTDNNTIKNNIIYGGGAAVMDWLDESLHDVNNIVGNIWYNDPAFGLSDEDFYLELSWISQFGEQIIVTEPPLADPKGGDFTVTYQGEGGPFGTDPNTWEGIDYKGDAWKFNMDFIGLYAEFSVANDEVTEATKFLETLNVFDYEELVDAGYTNLRDYLNDKLYEAGFVNSTIPYILKVWAPRNRIVDGWAPSGANNGPDPYGIVDLRNNRAGNNMLPDILKHENTMDHANGNINLAALANLLDESGGELELKYYVEVITRYNDGMSFTQAGTLGGLVIKAGGGPVEASAKVTKLSGNQNEITITVTEYYTNGIVKNVITATYLINNNGSATFQVGKYNVYVATSGNTVVTECKITGVMPWGKPVVIPTAVVTKASGNTNDLVITVTVTYPNGVVEKFVSGVLKIANSGSGIFTVGDYKVYVETKGNDAVTKCYIIE